MSLLQYFKRKKNCPLPNLKGKLAAIFPPQIIIAANNQARATQDKRILPIHNRQNQAGKNRKYASLHGLAATVGQKGLKDSTDSTVRNLYKKKYCEKYKETRVKAKPDEVQYKE